MYKVGNYEYKSKFHYERIVIRVTVVFIVCAYLLLYLKDNMNYQLFVYTFVVDIFMIIHLMLRLAVAKGYLKSYIFNEY